MTLTPDTFIKGFITAHEGGMSIDPKDNGNWSGMKAGVGRLIGSNYGVTGAAIAQYRGVPLSSIGMADVRALTIDEAVKIGVKNYYKSPGFEKLPWNRVTASIVDKGWGSGPVQAVKLLQRTVGVLADGKLGPNTVKAFNAWYDRLGEEAAAHEWAAVRIKFDTSLNQKRFIKGWNNRTRSFLPGTVWWKAWG